MTLTNFFKQLKPGLAELNIFIDRIDDDSKSVYMTFRNPKIANAYMNNFIDNLKHECNKYNFNDIHIFTRTSIAVSYKEKGGTRK